MIGRIKELTNNKLQLLFSVAIVLLIAGSRLIPHVDNFVPVFAMILFAVVHFKNKWQSVAISVGALWLSDLYINNWGRYAEYYNEFILISSPFNYLSYILIALIGIQLFKNTVSVKRVFGSSLLIGIVFFLVSNFGVWLGGFMYPLTLDGLLSCYIAAIPFFRATLASNI
ncbi:MAG: hypothetical protein CMG47_00590, partial [Candidatus Marinimicrobia bacterium]|nr:hypothetical protein [Candidatus Neomarinimicrobiota bacterium]